MKNQHHFAFIFLLIFSTFLQSCRHKDEVISNNGVLIRDSADTAVDSLSFIVVGDWGRKGGEYQQAVADQMDVYARKFNVQFFISTGDNFYEHGVTSVNDPQWKSSFENIYNKSSQQVTWYATLGNHDYHSNPQAQVDYTALGTRWKMPARYYAIERKIDSSHKVFFAFTDTSPFVNSYYGSSEDKADLSRQDTAAQLSWLGKELDSSNDTWKIAVGHHPVYSSGSHGNTQELVERFKPLFIQSKTDFYLCGHDHVLEYLTNPGEPVRYLVSGGGSEKYPVYESPLNHFAKSSPGFLVMTLYARKANFYFYDEKGVLLFSEQVTK